MTKKEKAKNDEKAAEYARKLLRLACRSQLPLVATFKISGQLYEVMCLVNEPPRPWEFRLSRVKPAVDMYRTFVCCGAG